MSPDTAADTPPDEAVFAEALLNPAAPVPPTVARADGGDPQEAFAIYRNNVMASLIDALVDTFPITVQLLGEEPSRALMAAFVRQSPPRSPVLATFGQGFPDFLATQQIGAQRPFLVDLARIENLLLDAYHAADATPLDGATLAAVDPDALGSGRLVLHPATRIMRSAFPVASIHSLEKAGLAGADLQEARGRLDLGRGECALVTRPAYAPQIEIINAGAWAFFTACEQAQSFEDAAEAGFSAQTDFDLQATLSLGLASGAFADFAPSEVPSSETSPFAHTTKES